MSNVVLRAEGLGKRYRVGTARPKYPTLRDRLVDLAKAPLDRARSLARGDGSWRWSSHSDLWALRDVSFQVEHGECLGIIGPNGAGKSTLLKILSRVTEPTAGFAEVYGRVGSLLEVGVGFHPELTGRENVYLSGAILGMSRREIRSRFDEIVAFAEIDQLLDTPVKFYSSGMTLRLGFAVAAHLEPDIVLTDEVLAVGDAAFQRKCIGKLGAVATEGRTVLFVSHQMDMIRALCDRCLLLQRGEIVAEGRPDEVIESYLRGLGAPSGKTAFRLESAPGHRVEIASGKIVDSSGSECALFDTFDPVTLEIEYVVREPVEGAVVCMEVRRNGAFLFQSFDSDVDAERLERRRPGRYSERVTLPSPLLKSGHYTVSLATGIANKGRIHYLEDALAFEIALLSKPSSFLSYSDNRPGVLVVPLVWERRTAAPLARDAEVPE